MDDATQQNQEIHVSGSLESMVVCQNSQKERNSRPQQEPALKCPRCDSINTKFCYYNNYSLTQPRYFCKSCRRYWTKGGTLRNIPVGGGCRKNKKSFSSSPSSSSSSFNKFLNDKPFAFDPIMASYYNSSDFSHPYGPPHRIENFDLVSGFENHYSSETLKNRLIESYLSSRQKLQSGYEHAEINGWKPANDHEEVGNSTTTSVMKTTAKVELFGGRVNERKIMREFPWQINRDGTGVDFDTGKDYQSCNEISSSRHHGLLYSPSM